MRSTFTLGRIFGIRVGVNWSVLVIFALIASSLATSVLPHDHPGRTHTVYWALGLVTAALFFLCLLAHEVSHALVARRNGLKVEGITLWLLGGVARIEGEVPGPAAELRIAGVGPLVSLLLGLFFAGVAGVARMGHASGLLVDAAAWLGGINILLAVFNSIPAAPLDGGRLLRAFVWWRTGSRTRSTQAATAAGRYFGWGLVFFGMFLTLATGALGGLWFALIGWFLIGASTAEGQQSHVRGVLAGVAVRQIMTPDPVTAPASITVERFIDGDLFRLRHSAFPLTAGGTAPIGVITLSRIKRVPPGDRATTRLRDVMCPLDKVATASPDEPVADVLPRLNAGSENRVLVLDGERLVGIVSPSDISRAVQWMALGGPAKD
jgi:Zn-dependent protease/CBS domain-containing protein